MYVCLLFSLNAFVSKTLFLVRFSKANDACIKTYNIDPSDGGKCHPDSSLMYCDGIGTVTISGKCLDGSVGSNEGLMSSVTHNSCE